MDFYSSLNASSSYKTTSKDLKEGPNASHENRTAGSFKIDEDFVNQLSDSTGSFIVKNDAYFPRNIEDLKKMRE